MDLIRVGAFELYPSERMLCTAGKPVELGARAFDLLVALVEHRGRLVTKATLLDRVWPRLVVDENNLPAQIASLRRVLGAGAIRTVPGFGYRLELEVMDGSGEPPAAHTGVLPSTSSQHQATRLNVPRRAWPERLGPLIDRDEDLRGVRQAFARSGLVTVVGPAGVGKTRLAQEILAREAEISHAAAAWVSLGPIEDCGLVPSAIAVALGLSLPDGVNGFVALGQALETESLLLVLDCAERLANALAEPLSELLAHTQNLRLLITSQVPLGIGGEVVYRLRALSVPQPGAPQEEVERCGAVTLFVEKATAADRRFELSAANTALVAEICRRLDGIPLALELAAARVPALGLASLLDRLDDRFRLLKLTGRLSDPRHGALHAALDWSYGLLAPSEQCVFNRLGVFAGSFSLTAAACCVADETIETSEAIDLIGRLVDRSLVTLLAVDPPRYALTETARHYALERLAAGNELDCARKHLAATMSDLLDLAYEEYWSVDEVVWLHRYEPELPNVRAAIDWAMDHDRSLCVALFGSAWPLFVETDLHAEGRTRYSQVLALLSDDLPRARVGRFWEAIATYDSTRQCDRARYAAELAAKMYAATGDARLHYYALMQFAFNWRVDTDAARMAFDTARQLEDPAWPARLLTYGALTEGALLTSGGQFAEARAAYQRAMRFALTTSERQALAATVNVVELDIARGDTAAALQLARPLALSLRYVGRRDTRFELLVLTFSALLMSGEVAEARGTGAELYELAVRLDTSKLYTVLDAMAFLALSEGCDSLAARIAAYADIAHETHGQVHRRPAEERMRTAVTVALDERLGSLWRNCLSESRERLDEAMACELALGLRV